MRRRHERESFTDIAVAQGRGTGPSFRRCADRAEWPARVLLSPTPAWPISSPSSSTIRSAPCPRRQAIGEPAAMSSDLAWVMTAEGAVLLTQCHIPYMQIRNDAKAMRSGRDCTAAGVRAQAAVPTGAVGQSRGPAAGLLKQGDARRRGFARWRSPRVDAQSRRGGARRRHVGDEAVS
jgi:hypothetical protein